MTKYLHMNDIVLKYHCSQFDLVIIVNKQAGEASAFLKLKCSDT